MDKTEKLGGPEPTREKIVQRSDLNKIRDGLVMMVVQIKANRGLTPYLREMIAISVRIPKSMYKYRNEFTFNQLENGIGVVRQLEEWIANLEKKNDKAAIVLDAYLYPYEQAGGKKLMAKTLKCVLPSADVPIGATVVVKTRKEAQAKIAEAVVVTEEAIAVEVIAKAEAPSANSKTVDVPLTDEVVTPMEMQETAISQKNGGGSGRFEVGEILAELLAQSERNANKINEQLSDPEEFFQKPINYDYRKWNLWSTDGTRGILRRTFKEHNIVSPGDLMRFLGTNDPTEQEWKDFIARLNDHNAPIKLFVGRGSENSLKTWMKKHKMIPEGFRKN